MSSFCFLSSGKQKEMILFWSNMLIGVALQIVRAHLYSWGFCSYVLSFISIRVHTIHITLQNVCKTSSYYHYTVAAINRCIHSCSLTSLLLFFLFLKVNKSQTSARNTTDLTLLRVTKTWNWRLLS